MHFKRFRMRTTLIISIVLVTAVDLTTSAADDPVNYTALFGSSPRQNLRFADLVRYDGYNVTEYNVTTKDGYILGLKEVRAKNVSSITKKIPLLFLHGLYLSGDDCIIPGPNKSICYLLCDNGYTVYVGNNRGNTYSRMHVSLNPDTQPKFWDFNFYDMAVKDLPAMIDFILNLTGATQLAIIGHSQGVTTALIMCADLPQYNDRIFAIVGTSPTGWLQHAKFPILAGQGVAAIVSSPFNETNNFEIFRLGGVTQKGVEYLCGISSLQYPYCAVLIFVAFGYNQYQISNETLNVVVGHAPDGTSYKNFIYWGQIYNQGFVRPDLGTVKNLQVYGTPTPPLYDLSAVRTKFWGLLGQNDNIGDPEDAKSLITKSKLRNATLCMIPFTNFGHLDGIYGDNIFEYIIKPILSVLNTGNMTDCIPA